MDISPVTGKETETSSQTPAIPPSVFELLQIKKSNPDLVIKLSSKGVL